MRSDRGSSGSSRARCSQLRAAAAFALVVSVAAGASAQTWSLERERPSLFEIVAVDKTARPLWPYGQEDLANDKVATYEADEAAVDLRSLYVSSRSDLFWLRAYVESDAAPVESAVVFFFLDTDGNTKTGGKAEGNLLFKGWTADTSPGGYEVAIGMRGDETLLGVWLWNTPSKVWAPTLVDAGPEMVQVETGKARDPLRLLGEDHGYFQVAIESSVAKLIDNGCTGPIFVRSWNDDPMMKDRAFGDSMGATSCKVELNAYGDPLILGSDRCDSDSTCPAHGKCRERVCVFEYECKVDDECRENEDCAGSVCVRVVDKSCDSANVCDGLVCASGKCTTCSDSGARACASGYLCTPNGTCIRPGQSTAGKSGSGGSGGSGADGGAAGERVQGGAFTCTAFSDGGSRGAAWSGIAASALAAVWLVRRRRRTRNARGGR